MEVALDSMRLLLTCRHEALMRSVAIQKNLSHGLARIFRDFDFPEDPVKSMALLC
jgi:hypothetical protein